MFGDNKILNKIMCFAVVICLFSTISFATEKIASDYSFTRGEFSTLLKQVLIEQINKNNTNWQQNMSDYHSVNYSLDNFNVELKTDTKNKSQDAGLSVNRQFVAIGLFDALITLKDCNYSSLNLSLYKKLKNLPVDAKSSFSDQQKVDFLVEQELLSPQFNNYDNPEISKAESLRLISQLFSYPFFIDCNNLVEKNVIDGVYISQVKPVYAPVGCEATALLMALKAKGYASDIDLSQFLDALPKTESHPACGFVGSPYIPDLEKKTRTTIAPTILAKFAQDYGNVVDISASTTEEIKSLLLADVPIVVYMTLDYEQPYYRWYELSNGEKRYWLSNNHAILLAGYDAVNQQYFIRDPYNVNNQDEIFEYWMSAAEFDVLYNERRYAVAVFDNDVK